MKFNANAPFWQFMNTLARFTALNLVYLVTLIPVSYTHLTLPTILLV